MRRYWLTFMLLALLLSLVISSGCSDERRPTPSGPDGSDLVTVTGEVTFIYDNVPADGYVLIDLKLDDGGEEHLQHGPVPWEDDADEFWSLYYKILQVEIGDWVRAEGRRVEGGIALKDLTILRR